MRRGNAGQISLVQSVTGRELDEEWHRRADEMRMGRLAVLPAIDVSFHDAAGIVDVTAVETRAMIDVFPDHAEMPDRSAMAFATTGNAR